MHELIKPIDFGFYLIEYGVAPCWRANVTSNQMAACAELFDFFFCFYRCVFVVMKIEENISVGLRESFGDGEADSFDTAGYKNGQCVSLKNERWRMLGREHEGVNVQRGIYRPNFARASAKHVLR